MIDVDEIRRLEIQMHGLSGVDDVLTFYHDETNNIHKLRVNAGGLNVTEPKVFALGGVVHVGPPHGIDITPLRAAMRIQASASEIKLEHVAKGDFLAVLSSPKLTEFLRWLTDSDMVLHYQELDPLYWSIVDVIDSILHAHDNLTHMHAFHMALKSDLVVLLRGDLAETTKLFHAYGYPGLEPQERRLFTVDLLALIECQAHLIEHYNYMMLKGVIQAGRNADSLVFIEDNPRHVLIEQFADFHRNRVTLFKNAHHVFDEEASIQESFLAVPLTSGGAPFVNYRFADSKTENGIQISDIVIGLLGKMHSYFLATSTEAIELTREGLSGVSLNNALLLRDLISKSHQTNMAFQQHVASIYDRDKADRFLRFVDGRYV